MYSYIDNIFQMKITNLKEILLKSKKQCIYLDFQSFTNFDECLDCLCNKIKDTESVVVLKTSNITPKTALDLSLKIRQIVSLFSSLFLIEDRSDIVKLANADGILLTNDSIDISYIKKLIDEEKFFAYFKNSNKDTDISCFDFLILNDKKFLNDNFKCFVVENNNDNK